MDMSSSLAVAASFRKADVFAAASTAAAAAATFLPSLPADRELLLSFC
jgi:hypothetical protein